MKEFKWNILSFELNTIDKYDILERVFSKQLETKATFPCFERKKNKKRWEDEYQKLYIAAEVDAS